MATEARRLHEQLGDVGLHAGTVCWLEWGCEYCPVAVICEAEAEESRERAQTPSSSQAVSAALGPVTRSAEDISMESSEDLSEAGMRRSTRMRKSTAKSKAAVLPHAPSSSDNAKTAEQAGSSATAAEEGSGALEDLDKAADNSGDEGEAGAELRGASGVCGASTTLMASSKWPVEDEDNEAAPPSKRTRSDTVMPGSKRGWKPLPDQEPQMVRRKNKSG
jgi:hypothetical protein